MLRDWTRWSSFGWLDHLSDRLHRQPTGRTTRQSLLLSVHFAADQLVRLLIAWVSSSATLGLASYAGDSSVFEFFVQASPAKLGTPLVVGSCYVLLVCYQAAPCCSDQGADLGQHVWGLDKYMTDDVGKLSDLFLLTLLLDLFLYLPAGSGTKWLYFTWFISSSSNRLRD